MCLPIDKLSSSLYEKSLLSVATGKQNWSRHVQAGLQNHHALTFCLKRKPIHVEGALTYGLQWEREFT